MSIRNLGVIFDSKVTMAENVNNVTSAFLPAQTIAVHAAMPPREHCENALARIHFEQS